MFILASSQIPAPALEKLTESGTLLYFSSVGITYPSISNHPDIFFVQNKNGFLVAPNLPMEMKNILRKNKISYQEGKSEVGNVYPLTAFYNAVITDKFLIHNLKITDSKLLAQNQNLEKIQVNQAYTRCNLLALKENHFITSDRGIEKVLRKKQCEVLYVNPEKIILPGMKHGFFGGCCGVFENTVYIIGNLDFIPGGKNVRDFIRGLGFELVELYDGPLFDGGSLIFIS